MTIAEKDIHVLEKHIPNIRELMHNLNVTDILEMIDDLIIDDILEHDDEPSEAGKQLQLIYDKIESSL